MTTGAAAGGYRLVTQIGFGPLGVVWEAEGSEGVVAVTVVAKALAEVPETRKALRRAAAAAAKLSHHGIARILGSRELYGELLLIAELLPGETMTARLVRKPSLTGAEIARLAVTLTEALAYLHRQGLVHGGVNPENIFLTKDGKIKLLQTGAARVQSEARLRLGGAVAEQAPELGAGTMMVTAASDIWSLGKMLQRLAPSAGDLTGISARCLQRDPLLRPTATQLCAELGGTISVGESAPAMTSSPKSVGSPPLPKVGGGKIGAAPPCARENVPPVAAVKVQTVATPVTEVRAPGGESAVIVRTAESASELARPNTAAETDNGQGKIQRRVVWGLAVAGVLLLLALVVSGGYIAMHPELLAGNTATQRSQRTPAVRRGATAGDRTAEAEPVIAARLNTARFSAPAAFLDGVVYVFGGNNAGTILATAESYDPATKRAAKFEAEFLPRSCHAAGAESGLIYLVGGLAKDGVSGTLEIFNPGAAGEVTMGAPMPTPRYNASAALLDGKLFVAGGSTRAATDLTDVLEIYDIANDRWTTGAPLPSPRQTELVAWGGKIYALGGYPGEGSSDECFAYDPQKDEWNTLPAMSHPVSAHRAAALGSELYTFGSYDALDQVLRFKARNWERIAVPFLPRRHASLAADRDRVWVLGGTNDGTKALDAIQEFTASQLVAAAVK